MKLRHEIEVHSIETTYQSGRQEDDVDDCKDLNDIVLLDVYQTEESILEVVETVETELGVIEQRVDIFDNHR